MRPNQHNIDILQLKPCEACGEYKEYPGQVKVDEDQCDDHWPEGITSYSHLLIAGIWYTIPLKYKAYVGALIEIQAGMTISGRLDFPEPKRVDSLTDLLTLLIKQGVKDEVLVRYFPEAQIKRMKGRVFKKLVKGR